MNNNMASLGKSRFIVAVAAAVAIMPGNAMLQPGMDHNHSFRRYPRAIPPTPPSPREQMLLDQAYHDELRQNRLRNSQPSDREKERHRRRVAYYKQQIETKTPKIQSVARRFLAKNKANELRRHVANIQSVVRRYLAKNKANELRRQRDDLDVEKSITEIIAAVGEIKKNKAKRSVISCIDKSPGRVRRDGILNRTRLWQNPRNFF
jgi:hypothetical protein